MSALPVSDTEIPVLWSAEGLHYLSQLKDDLADQYIEALANSPERDAFFKKLFRMDSNSEETLDVEFPMLKQFFDETYKLPDGVDHERIRRGEEVFLHHMTSGALALLAKSLPEGYSAPRLSKILDISGYLESHAYKRLLATLHMLINVSSSHGFTSGHAVVIAQKLRLWHSAVRFSVGKYIPDYKATYEGEAVNQCDMLATIMGFSLVVIQGWRKLGLHPFAQHEEDFYYLWKVYALMMGIHPEGEPHNFAHIPETVADAEKFYAAYCKQYYVEAVANPEGVRLAKANLNLLREMVPWWLAIFGLRTLPRAYMQLLIGADGCARIGLPFRLHEKVLEWCLHRFHNMFFVFEALGRFTHIHLPLLIFKVMIYKQYGTGTQIMIPPEIADVWYERARSAKKLKK